MKTDKARAFQYIKIENSDRRYFCLQQNLAVLAWILFFKNFPLQPVISSDSNKLSFRFVMSWFWKGYKRFRKNLVLLIHFVGYKYQLKSIDEVKHFPIYGQLCVPTHKGYKIFDLRRKVATKIFDSDVHLSSISGEIDQLKNISKNDVAPSLKKWNIEERWYEEDYISGSSDDCITRDSVAILDKFYQDIAPCIIDKLILFQRPKIKNAIEYINEVTEVLAVSKLSKQAASISEFNKIESFIGVMIDRLHLEGTCPIFLVFTHGDFVPANMLNTRNGLRVVDWEDAIYRSPLYDFYSYFFLRIVSWRCPVDQVVSEINAALSFLVSGLGKKEPSISNSLLHLEKEYRLIYYIELVCRLVKREMTDKNLDIMDYILGYIEAFNNYEKVMVWEK